MRDLFPYLILNKEFFEDLKNYPVNSESFLKNIKDILPKDWKVEKYGIWFYIFRDGINLPNQGFKIHISATSLNAEEILKLVLPVCIKEKVSLKIIIDKNLLNLVNSKNYFRGSSGKFITIYPSNRKTFKKLIWSLYEKTKDIKEAPYILSDKPFRDSKILFYRYGGFKIMEILNIDGTRTPVILSPNGEFVPDERLPFFKLPEWIKDPFNYSKEKDIKVPIVLNKRYKVQEALSFSNSGGVYKGIDLATNKKVIIKEARPFTNLWWGNNTFFDATHILEKEFKILKKLGKESFVPKAIDFFKEWEHLFLVEEYVRGIPLSNYRASDEFAIIPFLGIGKSKIKKFYSIFKLIATNLIKAITKIHSYNIILGDISPSNILINPENLNVKIVDFESALDLDNSEGFESFSSLWATPGFASPERIAEKKITFKDDFYSIGMVLYSLILPVQAFFDLSPNSKDLFIDRIIRSTGLPPTIKNTVFYLLKGDEENAKKSLKRGVLKILSTNMSQNTKTNFEELHNELSNIIQKIKDFILDTIDINREDRLCPSDYKVFWTNPLNIAWGASGIILFLTRVSKRVPKKIIEWLLNQSISNIPPGLYTGLSGIAYLLNKLGYKEKALEMMDLVYNSPLAFVSSSLFQGASGWGLISLNLYIETQKKRFLDKACEAGEYVIKSSIVRKGKCFWKDNEKDKINLGIADGGSGISLFLLYLYLLTKEKKFLDCALKGIEFEISQAIEVNGGLRWGRCVGDKLFEPYWLHGSAGIGSVLIRFAYILNENRYKKLAHKASKSAFSKFTVLPSQFEGLAGIGEFMLDMYLFTKNEDYLKKAYEIADSILLYKIERPEGVAFPGSYLLRISNDYGTGSAGIGLFFERLLSLGKREFHDLF